MKPSEYFLQQRIKNQMWYDSDEANETTIIDLDLKFIDKDELKEKITEKIKSLKKHHNPGMFDNYNLLLDLIKEEILKLLDE